MENQNYRTQATLTRDQIVAALQTLSERLGAQSITGEICLFGGTVMVLAFAARLTTKDVDAIFQPAEKIRELARKIGGRTCITFGLAE